MPKDSIGKPVYTRFDAMRDELKSVYYGSYVVTTNAKSSAKRNPVKKVATSTPKKKQSAPASLPSKLMHHAA